jgi:cytochrome c-type biogenesis protein CcmE
MTEQPTEKLDPPSDPPPPERLEVPDDGGDDGLNWRLVVGVLVTAALIGFFVVDGLESKTYFFTVDEAVAKAGTVDQQKIRVKGSVVDGTIQGEDGDIGRTFEISEKGEQLRIQYDQAVPDTFEPGVQVVATGRLDEQDTLQASKLMVKCPSRYEGKPPTAHEKKGPSGPRSSR